MLGRILVMLCVLASTYYVGETYYLKHAVTINQIVTTKPEHHTQPTPPQATTYSQKKPVPITTSSWLNQQSFHINPTVVEVLLAIVDYAKANQIEHSNIITIIDYSLPANEKRLWIFDFNSQQLLFHTYVSHGLKSGSLSSHFFSNRNDSKASSIGVYRTEKAYYGRHGISLKLDGLDRGFNDNAESRAIVMHGGWYVEEDFINKYGRAGRSWGCPAVSDKLVKPIIDTIKNKSLLIVYYPSHEWLFKSKFLKQDAEPVFINSAQAISYIPSIMTRTEQEPSEDVLFAPLEKKNKYHETEAILVMPAKRYETMFQTQAPLKRMLRRQIDQEEYIALSTLEFNQMITFGELNPEIIDPFKDLYFVVPEIVMVRGYYATEMNKINLGKIKNARHYHYASSQTGHYMLELEDHSVIQLRTSHKFIRWLGL